MPANLTVSIDSAALANAIKQHDDHHHHDDDDVACGDIDDDVDQDDTSGGSGGFARSTDADRRHFYQDARCEYGYERDHGAGGLRDRDRRRDRTAANQRARHTAARHICTDAYEMYDGTGDCACVVGECVVRMTRHAHICVDYDKLPPIIVLGLGGGYNQGFRVNGHATTASPKTIARRLARLGFIVVLESEYYTSQVIVM